MVNNENIVYRAKKSLFIFLIPTIMCILFYATNHLLLIAFIPYWLINLAMYFSSQLIITDKRVFGQSGILKTYTIDTLIENVTSITIEKSFLGRIFNFGDIIIAAYDDKIKFSDISKPEKFREEFYSLIV